MSEKNNSTGMNELVDYQQKNYGKTMDAIMRFLWKCGGADAQILRYAPYADHIKAAGIGGVVLATTVMAMIAMGFAMHTIFGENDASGHHGNWAITIPVALVWGLIIFNLDRFIVSTVKGDGTEKITLGEWGAMLPRLFMAIIIGLTISAPLETYIFQKEILREWGLSMKQLAMSEEYRIEQENNNLNKRTLDEYKIKKEQVAVQQEIYNKANQEYQDEISGKNTGNGWGDGPVAKKKNEIVQRELKTLEGLKNELSILEGKKQEYIKNIEDEKDKSSKKINESVPGFLDQLMMLERLSSTGKTVPKFDPATNTIMKGKEIEIYGSAFWPIWLVRILFMIVEIAPVIFKFMIWDSSYDYMKDNVAQILEAKQGISLESFPDENNKAHKIRKNYNAERIVEVAKRQNELEKENAIHAITLYAEQERQEIDKNPGRFVQGDQKDEGPDISPVTPENPATASTENASDDTVHESTNNTKDSSDEGQSTQPNNNSEDTIA